MIGLKMELVKAIRAAFNGHIQPEILLNIDSGRGWYDTDEADADWIAKKKWEELTTDDWEAHYRGLYFLTNAAVAYYLPSIMLLSIDDSIMVTESLMICLYNDMNHNVNTSNSLLRYLNYDQITVLIHWINMCCGRIYVGYSVQDILSKLQSAQEQMAGGLDLGK